MRSSASHKKINHHLIWSIWAYTLQYKLINDLSVRTCHAFFYLFLVEAIHFNLNFFCFVLFYFEYCANISICANKLIGYSHQMCTHKNIQTPYTLQYNSHMTQWPSVAFYIECVLRVTENTTYWMTREWLKWNENVKWNSIPMPPYHL